MWSLKDVQVTLLMLREFTFLGLFLIALGTGGIKPCVAAFGGILTVLLPEHFLYVKTHFYFHPMCPSSVVKVTSSSCRSRLCSWRPSSPSSTSPSTAAPSSAPSSPPSSERCLLQSFRYQY
jgi:hypothetical protein